MVGAGMLDYVFVKRLNLKWGISDRAFVLGDEASLIHTPLCSPIIHSIRRLCVNSPELKCTL